MLNLQKVVKPWREAASLSAQINLYGFWSETAFLTKSGDLGIVLRVEGVDYESLDSQEQNRAVHRLEAAMKAFGPGFHVYQYLFKTNRPEIPFAEYADPIVSAAVQNRRAFFEQKRDCLYRVEMFYVILLRSSQGKQGIASALASIASEPRRTLHEVRALLSGTRQKRLLRKQIAAQDARLQQAVEGFRNLLQEFTASEILGQQEQLRFFRRLLNFDVWRIAGKPSSTQFLDYQVVNSDIEAERDHLRVGEHLVRLLTLKEAVSETRPLVLHKLLKAPASFHVVTEWMPIPADRARQQVNTKRRHFNVSKLGMVSGARKEVTLERDQLIDEDKQSDITLLGECQKLLGNGASLGEFSLTVVLHGKDIEELQSEAGRFAGIFTDADGGLFLESYNQLNALFACVPGNYRHNLRRLLLLNANYADLGFLFTILPGQQTNAHLGTEYLAVLETENQTPYYLNLHHGEVAHTLILGRTGSGKSFLLNFLVLSAQKYKPLTYVFDIGGSFESLTRTFAGAYVNAGRESRDLTINPFSLEPTQPNLQFLFSFFRVLFEGAEQRFRLDHREERQLWNAIERMYVLAPEHRTITTFSSIIGDLRERLHRWTTDGQYGFVFDNVEDNLTFADFQAFNFAGWGDAPDVLEPLLFYVLHRATAEITNDAKLATFKTFVIDEAWHFIKNATIREYVIGAMKTWRKHNAAMILATQSLQELEGSGILPVIVEQLGTTIFLANPKMNREVYSQAFHLNDTELELIAGLVPPGEMLVKQERLSKKVRLTVDAMSYWIATNNARDNVKKREYFARYGTAEGLRRLAAEHDPSARTSRVVTIPKHEQQQIVASS